jgi:protein MpaA
VTRRAAAALLGTTVLLGACSAASSGSSAVSPSTAPGTVAAAAAATTAVATTIATTTIPPATAPPTAPPTTPAPTDPPTDPPTTSPAIVQQVELGRSVEGRPITAVERGTPGGTAVLVIGCIHGDEDAGIAVIDRLMTATIPAGVDLWLVPSMNPDGQAHQVRSNAHQVDLNRNFPQGWAPLGQPGDSQYAGTGPASEPETAAIVTLVEQVRPTLTVWYHQDLNRIDVGTGRAGQIQRRYAQLTGLPVEPVTGGTYTGTATQWEAAKVPKGVAFIVELGPTLDSASAATHADAVLTLASAG